ncbi:peroxiredoxin [Dokdonia sp. Hel_I_53]|uniref:peroxiredoxin n=1 Tax=Dokdonia sp. Hel_I_53 TaxID=1566287 RepID=UPI00119A5240|nr:peroxiredoxin [Dokdonia sp. Hel_I_53]TVZ51635.1 peroxiredoxin Q/BCP [Dokdonia sp. Hel_I_53]
MGLKIGDKAPAFKLKNQNGEVIYAGEYLGNTPLIIYFYPKNFTPGCTAQACSFRDQYQDFLEAGAKVFGISSDSVESHKRFREKHHLPFDTLADKSNSVRRRYGVKGNLLGLIPGRETFVIDKDGVIQMKFNSMAASQHIPKALEVVKSF